MTDGFIHNLVEDLCHVTHCGCVRARSVRLRHRVAVTYELARTNSEVLLMESADHTHRRVCLLSLTVITIIHLVNI